MQTDPQYKLRLPSDLKEKIKQASERNHRSMNAEIVARLEESFQPAVGEHRVPTKVWKALEDAVLNSRREKEDKGEE